MNGISGEGGGGVRRGRKRRSFHGDCLCVDNTYAENPIPSRVSGLSKVDCAVSSLLVVTFPTDGRVLQNKGGPFKYSQLCFSSMVHGRPSFVVAEDISLTPKELTHRFSIF